MKEWMRKHHEYQPRTLPMHRNFTSYSTSNTPISRACKPVSSSHDSCWISTHRTYCSSSSSPSSEPSLSPSASSSLISRLTPTSARPFPFPFHMDLLTPAFPCDDPPPRPEHAKALVNVSTTPIRRSCPASCF